MVVKLLKCKQTDYATDRPPSYRLASRSEEVREIFIQEVYSSTGMSLTLVTGAYVV